MAEAFKNAKDEGMSDVLKMMIEKQAKTDQILEQQTKLLAELAKK